MTIDDMYRRFNAVRRILEDPNNIAQGGTPLSVFVDEQFTKSLLLAVASGFEAQLSESVRDMCRGCINGENPGSDTHPLMGLVESKVISREYHKWFDWNAPNANKFFRMFGEGFSEYAKEEVKKDVALGASIRSFMDIGKTRNALVHEDFVSFEMQKTAEDVYQLYNDAQNFVNWVPKAIESYLDNLDAGTKSGQAG